MALSPERKQALFHPVKWFFNPVPPGPGRIANRELSLHALGLAGQNQVCGMTGGWFFYFCNTVMKVPPHITGWIFGLSSLWDGINDPIAGAVIDKFRFKSGDKLRPWILYTAPLIGVFGSMMFFNFGFKSQSATITVITIFFFLYDMFFSFQDIALWGMTAMMSPLSEEREKASQWARIGASLGGLLASIIYPVVSLRDRFTMPLSTFFFICALIFCLGGSLISMLAYNAQERIPAPKEENESIWANLYAFRHNHMLLLLLLGSVLKEFSPRVDDIYVFQDVNYDVFGTNMTGEGATTLLTIITGFPGMASMFFATKAAKKIGGMKNILILATVSDIVVRLGKFAVGYKTFWRLTLTFIINIISSIPNNMTGIASTALWGDSLDYLEWKTGKRAEGIAFSLQIFIVKIGRTVGSIIKGYLLKWMEYDMDLAEARKPQTSEKFKKYVWSFNMLGPIVGAVLYLICVLLVKYPAEMKAKVEAELAERRAATAAATATQTKKEAAAEAATAVSEE